METTPTKTTERSTPVKAELTRRQKLARRFLPAVALSLAAGGYAAHSLGETAEASGSATTWVEIDNGQTTIDAVAEGVSQLDVFESDEHITNADIVSEGQEVNRELTEQTGNKYVQPGDVISVTISKDSSGNYELEAEPSRKAE